MVWRMLASATAVAVLLTLASVGVRLAEPGSSVQNLAGSLPELGGAGVANAPEPAAATPRLDAGPLAEQERPVGKLLWVGDFESGDLSQYQDTPWNQVGSPDPRVVNDRALVRDGRHALALTIPAGGNRNEVVPATEPLEAGDELYFGFSTMLGAGFPVDQEWQVLTQWKNDGEGSPPLSLSIEKGNYLLHGGYGHPDGPNEFRRPLAKAVPGEWSDWVFRIRFSPDPEVGFVEVWRNGALVMSRFRPATGTLYPGLDSYLKTGYYRDQDIDVAGTVYLDNWRVGSTRTIAARARG